MTSTNQVALAEVRQQFADEIVQTLGYGPRPDKLINRKIVRFSTRNGDPHDDAGWAVWFEDYSPVPAGAFGDHRNGDGTHYWHFRTKRRYTKEECADYHRQIARRRKQLEAAEAERHEKARQKAHAMLEEATDDPAGHQYLLDKGVKPHAGIRRGRADIDYPGFDSSDCLLIPLMTIDGAVHSIQLIDRNGAKRYLKGGRKKGCHFPIGDRNGDGEVLIGSTLNIAEGYSTTSTVYEASSDTSIMASDSGNILAVAQAFRDLFPDLCIRICADDDWKTLGNPGLTKAQEAARAVRGLVAIPGFGPNRQDRDTDFHDMATHLGLEAVRAAIHNAEPPPSVDIGERPPKPNGAASGEDYTAMDPAEGPPSSSTAGTADPSIKAPPEADGSGPNGAATTGDDTPGRDGAGDGSRTSSRPNEMWPVPQPVVTAMEPSDYPLDALPPRIKAAVKEVAKFVKAPMSLVASSALSILSTVGQAYVDVARADRLTGPASLFMLTVADSGERKTTCDNLFAKPLTDYERVQSDQAKPKLQRYKADLDAWAAEREGILISIKLASKKGNSVDSLHERLQQLEEKRPQPPRVPQLIHGDDTTESLAWSLAREWPSAGILTSEAGTVLGGHAMGTDSIMRNLSQKNVLWDGGDLRIGRRTSESFTVRGARLTMGLQVQEVTLRTFFDKSKGLARGSGWLARFLLNWPRSTQGQRPYGDPPPGWPQLTAFNKRIAEILEMPVPIDNDGRLTPEMLPFSKEGKMAWITFHDVIEEELSTGGGFSNVRDVASKTADNAARIAALFHLFEHGKGGSISEECFDGASKIAAFHLNESRRFFGELALPPELANASRLDTWLIDYCRGQATLKVPQRKVRQFGPNGLREKSALDPALRELKNANRVRVAKDGHRIEIQVNPALLDGDITACLKDGV